MPELQLLRAQHAPALLNFELANRWYFAASIPDRGDDYFAQFDEHLRELLAAQTRGTDFLHVLVDSNGVILGRINLVDCHDGGAEIGYRIAEHAAGKGLATSAVGQVCALAHDHYGLTVVLAKITNDNVASRQILVRNGFHSVDALVLNSRPATNYRKDLAPTP